MTRRKKLNSKISQIDRYFIRNTIGISAVEMFWGLGLPVVMESTFLQLFLHRLGATSFLIGLIPTLFYIGLSVFSLFSGFFTSHLRQKRLAVIILHLFASVPMLLFGIFLKFTGFIPSTLRLFFSAYTLFSVGIGLILPTWQNYLVKIFTEKRVISAHSVMWISQSLGKFLSGFIIIKIISKYSFSSEGASMIFSLVGLLFVSGSLMFFITREMKTPHASHKSPSRFKTFLQDLKAAFHNRDFLFFLASDLEQFAVISILSFYANYATEYCAVKPYLAAGLFVVLNYSGSITINILLGWMDLLSLKNKYLAAKLLSLLTVTLLYFFPGLWAFLTASFLMGISRGTRSLVYAPSIKKLSGMSDSTNFFAIAPLLVMPLSAGLPLLAGTFLDHFSYLGGEAYRLMFLGMGVLIILGITFLAKVRLNSPYKERSKFQD